MHRDTARPKTRDGGAACSLGRAALRVAAAAGCLYDCARGGDAAGQGRRDARSLRGVLFADAVRPTERASPLRPRLASSLANFLSRPLGYKSELSDIDKAGEGNGAGSVKA